MNVYSKRKMSSLCVNMSALTRNNDQLLRKMWEDQIGDILEGRYDS